MHGLPCPSLVQQGQLDDAQVASYQAQHSRLGPGGEACTGGAAVLGGRTNGPRRKASPSPRGHIGARHRSTQPQDNGLQPYWRVENAPPWVFGTRSSEESHQSLDSDSMLAVCDCGHTGLHRDGAVVGCASSKNWTTSHNQRGECTVHCFPIVTMCQWLSSFPSSHETFGWIFPRKRACIDAHQLCGYL